MIYDSMKNFAAYRKLAPEAWEKVSAFLAGCTPEDIATPERAARVLETEALHTRVLLNQADAADGTALLARLHCPAALASLRKGEIVSCSF